jgi:hypothetical protein
MIFSSIFKNAKLKEFLIILGVFLLVFAGYLVTLEKKIEQNNVTENTSYCIEVYEPVCAEVEIQCVKAPCNPIHQTFANSCKAGKHKILYKGECK